MVKRCVVELEETLLRSAKVKAAKEGKTMKQIISEYLSEYAKDELEEIEHFERVKKEWPL